MAVNDLQYYLPEIYKTLADYLGISITTAIILFAIIGIWSLVWKGLALWKSARKNHLVWFIIFVIISTIGILEILYIYVFSELDKNQSIKIFK